MHIIFWFSQQSMFYHKFLYFSEVEPDEFAPNKPQPEGDFKCNKCERSFQSAAGLEQHKRRTHHSMIEIGDAWPSIKHRCTVCAKEFDSLKVFTRHKV